MSGEALALDGRRITIASVHYWPEETGIAPYATGVAEHLASLGADVAVLTAMPFYPHWQVFHQYAHRFRMAEVRNGVRVQRVRHYVPTRQSAAHRAAYEASFLLHGVPLATGAAPDAVIGVIPSISGGLLAAARAKRFNVPYGLIVQDLSGQAAAQSGIQGGSQVARLTSAIELRIARGARQVAVVAPAFGNLLAAQGVDPARIVELPNWTHIPPPSGIDRESVRQRYGWRPDEHIVLHAGNMGLKQALEYVVDAARMVVDTVPELRFVLMGDGSQRRALEQLAAGLPNVTFLPPVPAAGLADPLAAADILLVNERGSVVDMSLPSKLTSYFVAGRPVLAAVRPDGTTAREIARSGGGITVPPEQPDALLAGVVKLLRNEELSRRLGASGVAYAQTHLSRDTALARIDGFVHELLAGSSMMTLGDHPIASR